MPCLPEDPTADLSAAQQQLREIWIDVLKVKQIGPNDAFLDLGGDSLAAMLCISRIRRTFGVEFPLDEFFLDEATICHHARKIAAASPET